MMASVESSGHGKPAEARKCILFVEDNEDDFLIAWRQLRKLGISNPTHRVGCVEEMIDYLNGTGQYSDRKEFPMPSLMVLDLRLPKRDGLKAQAWLRSKLKYRDIPIILISTHDMINLLQAAVSLGADAYMLKPFDGHEFRRLILQHRLPVQFAQP